MIGNDIVDLALARKESNWNRRGYLDKIFTASEQLLISTALDPTIMVWNLWSRKEAAYKIYNRLTGIRGYFPLKLECVYENAETGSVSCNGSIFYSNTKIVQDEIHTISVTNIKDFERVMELDTEIKIVKEKGIPFLFDPITNILKPVSLSCHGRYSALVGLK